MEIMEIPKEINDLCYRIRGICIRVHNAIGPGFPEEYYQKALEYEFRKERIPFVAQKEEKMLYEGIVLGENFLDFLIDEKLILEIKLVNFLNDIHRFQVLKYLSVTGLDFALLVNFGNIKLQSERILTTTRIQLYRKIRAQEKDIDNNDLK
jgi:GxxExxY protein